MLLAIGGIILLSLVGVLVSFRSDAASSEQTRIGTVVTTYMNDVVRDPQRSPGPAEFLRSGARHLQSDAEVRSAVRQIVSRVDYMNAPFGTRTEALLNSDLNLREFLAELGPMASNFEELCGRHGLTGE